MESNYAKRRRWQREEAMHRRRVRPLRNFVNKTLKATGIPHSASYASGRIRGLSHSSEGWETDSNWAIERQERAEHDYVAVNLSLSRSSSLYGTVPPERLAWPDRIDKALRAVDGLDVRRDKRGCRWEVRRGTAKLPEVA